MKTVGGCSFFSQKYIFFNSPKFKQKMDKLSMRNVLDKGTSMKHLFALFAPFFFSQKMCEDSVTDFLKKQAKGRDVKRDLRQEEMRKEFTDNLADIANSISLRSI